MTDARQRLKCWFLSLAKDGSVGRQLGAGRPSPDSPRWRSGLALALLLSALALSAPAQNIVINEIMYHPASQDVREEFVELFNAGPTNVNLAGWTLSGGIAYTFPNTTLAAGGYLVVAAHMEAFTDLHPSVLNVVGG